MRDHTSPLPRHVGTACHGDRVLQLLPIFLSVELVVRKAGRCCCSPALAGRGSSACRDAPREQNAVGPAFAWIYTNLHTSVQREQLGKRNRDSRVSCFKILLPFKRFIV